MGLDLDRRDFLRGFLGSAAYGFLHPNASAQQREAPPETEGWDSSKAYRESTLTQERICVNGLWRWQPAKTATDVVPTGDWGRLDEDDRRQNEFSLENGYRLFSAYQGDDGSKFWIITEADRSVTTILLPLDY